MALQNPILGSFESIGESIIKSTAQVPKDIVTSAVESLGISTGSGKKKKKITTKQTNSQSDAWDQIEATNDTKIKETIARSALQSLVSRQLAEKQPDEWDKKNQEDEQKKLMRDQTKRQESLKLRVGSSRRPRGDLFGIRAKRHGSEIGKNAKSD